LNADLSVKGLDYVLRDDKPQTDSLCVNLLRVLQAAKELEKLHPIFLLYADSRVYHGYHKLCLFGIRLVYLLHSMLKLKLLDLAGFRVILVNLVLEEALKLGIEFHVLSALLLTFGRQYKLGNDRYLSSILRELECVRLQVDKHLLDPLLITLDGEIEHVIRGSRVVVDVLLACFFSGEAEELGSYLDVFGFSLILLYLHNFLNRPFNIESLYVLNKLACFQLGIAKDVLDVQKQKTRRGSHHAHAL
jgi:hypothetical protein